MSMMMPPPGPPGGLAALPPGPPGGMPQAAPADPVAQLTVATMALQNQAQQGQQMQAQAETAASGTLQALAQLMATQASPEAVGAQSSPGPLAPPQGPMGQ